VSTRVLMPQAGQDLETGLVRRWLKAEGDHVAKGEPLVEIETEKLALAVESPATGTLLRILVPDDSEVPILSTIGYIGEPGEDLPGDE
jgi:pyruvate/2-oxoglutarate dehydrogenase complex dihydrolipoamide acyltransferase (E2) component